jgi:tetratricopeptide (TPR) repeat protein
MRRVVRANPDASTHSYIKRMIETLIRLGKYDEAESELGALAATAATDSGYLLLQADIRSGKGDSRGARQSLDEAASRFNDEPMVFMRRAQWLMNQPDLLRDARADADKAVKLGPNLWQALRLRSMISYQLDMKDEAIGDLRAALRIAPSLDELREMLVDNLLRMDRVDEAVSVCDENIALRKDDQAVSASCGAIFARAGDWGRSARYYQKAFDTEKSVRNAGWLAGAMLNQTPPDIANAQKTLLVVQDKIASDGNLSMLRARLFKAQDKRAEAKQAAAEALKLMDPTSGAQMLRWYGDVQNIVADAKEMLPYLQGIEQAGTAKDWMVFFRANVMFNDPAQREQGSELMKTLTTSLDKPAALRLNAFRALTIAYYREKRWEDARAIMMKGLEQFPDDFELNNNLAFTLAKHLKRPAEALPYAEKIANSKQRAPEALDTLGYVYFLNNKLDEAQKALMAAIPMPQSAQSAAVAMIHLAEVSLAKGDKAEAKRLIEGVDKLLALPASGNALDPASKQELEDLRKRAE